MRSRTILYLLAVFAGCFSANGCSPEEMINGCKIAGSTCECDYGCRNEYTYRTRRACVNALKGAVPSPYPTQRIFHNTAAASHAFNSYHRPADSSNRRPAEKHRPVVNYQRPSPPTYQLPAETSYHRPAESTYQHPGGYQKPIVESPRTTDPTAYGTSSNKDKPSNICHQQPCVRGLCIQKTQDPGFSCKCEGTGFYGHRCEKACPTTPMRGQVFPYECIVI